MSRPFAAFDIDGTVIRWQLYHAIVDELGRSGHIGSDEYKQMRQARMVWKQRGQTESFSAYEHAVVAAYDAAITALSRADYLHAIEAVIDEYKLQSYTYTRNLIASLKQRGYLLFAISGSQQEAVKLLADFYGFDDFGGTVYEYSGGSFSGQKSVLTRDLKPDYLKQLVAKHDASWQGSIAVGDSDSDIPMLELVEQPIAFNPNSYLFGHAQKRGWKVVLERKNMVYELAMPRRGTTDQLEPGNRRGEAQHGSYILEQTNSN